MVSPAEVFGRRVRAARKARGIAVNEAALAVGVNHGGLWKMEEGWSPPWLSTMERLARLLHVPISWLAGVGGDEVPARCLPVLDGDQVRYGFGDRMRFARRARGLTQVEVARLLGVVQTTVSLIERGGRRTPTLDTIYRHCEALEVPVAWALGDDPDLSWVDEEPWRH